ncbi:recombinase family protein [Microbacterium sp. SORGH_AS_0862]|uniref:recombinase family protein n=1 Tax=Microbacterium sp. SORGH_AS_0862 TaxID=3041789 RepID=UPI002790EE34|nr:recombinase family protein [Microbacterium sp. SORGH_AS_0862]MDQ1206622.1 site-specific DNA recombinase [Microbacterium sp. SORGH_AS_0862]
MRAGIYVRISKDTEGTELGVTRQREDCERVAATRGWEVVQVYSDNDVSATRSKSRPAYERMVRDIRSGHLEAVVVWAVDRLTRTPRELEDIIDLADRHGLTLANVSGTIDLETPEGRAMARQMGVFARLEVENQARRLKRKFQEKAEKGEPHGYPPYGYVRVDGRDVPNDFQANIVRECARRVLARESLRSVVTDLNKRGEPGPKSDQWNTTILRQILMRPSNAGLRVHRGKVIGKATTEPIIDEDTHAQLVALLTDPSRRDNHDGPTPKYLLSGLALCGRCGGRMRRTVGRYVENPSTGATKRQPAAYQCSNCFRVRRQQELVDQVVEGVIVARLSASDAAELFSAGDSKVADACRQEIAGIEAKLDVVADQFAADEIDANQLKRITARLRDQRRDAERRREASKPRTVLTELAGPQAAERWKQIPLGAKREAVELLMTVTILPSGPGKRFDPDQIVIDWKTGT